MISEELKEYITFVQNAKSETEYIELKAAHIDCPKKLYDTLSSFSNRSGGGIIIFGIDESKDFEVVGVYDINDLQKKVVQQCNLMIPKIRPVFTMFEMEAGKYVVSAEIPEISKEEKPCYYSGIGIQKGSYIRVGDADEPMSDYEIYNYQSYKTKIQEDLRMVDRAELEDLDSEKLDKYLNKLKEQKPNLFKMDKIKILKKLGIIIEENNKVYPTVTGMLMFGLYPQAFFPQYVITAVVVPGYKMGDVSEFGDRFLDNKKIEGTIPEILDEAVNFIIKNMKWRTVIRNDNAKRDDKPEYPIKAIREALINALMHRDYSNYTEGSYIQIRMFNDRIEIQSPGSLYGGVTIDTLGDNKSETRNRNLVRILEDIDVVENRGSGIPTMIKEMRELRLEPPIFDLKRGDFWVIFKNHTLMTSQDILWIKDFNLELNEEEALALAFIRKNGKITNGEYQKLNNVNRDRALIELRDLIKKGVIKPQGIGSGTYYVLVFEQVINNMDHKSPFGNTVIENDVEYKIDTQDEKKTHKIDTQDEERTHKITPQDKIEDIQSRILKICVEPKSKKEIADFLKLSDIRYLTKKYLKPLIESGKLKMTIPNKVTSRNQKYFTCNTK